MNSNKESQKTSFIVSAIIQQDFWTIINNPENILKFTLETFYTF